ncbi:type IX secretion system sortase PorU [Gracilimonas mengyeensis]|uniref:Por secretion system C-terminal sorting domain-containing protein n=1 Tax=Gracilimonas mengyeensis TaxID=1302730 RepID=A0A521FG06_9BACT|nr:type IX secretion system sortase PorU [Gracilimonas mengyeensis]SMO94924.1 Por secretion system C-terminal sorting domain-containing protein [Gracilimonas mengyeensis]
MLTKLLKGSLLCLLFAYGVQAQQVKVVAETDTFTDYEFLNPNQEILSPHALTIPVSGGSPQFQILEQKVSTLPEVISQEKAAVMALADDNTPLIETSAPGVYRGKRVSPSQIHIARVGENSTKVLTSLKLRVYKQGERVLPRKANSGTETEGLFETGTWYKIPITKNSIYEIDADYLEELGVEVSSIDPQNIQIWGNGGYPLPEVNDAPKPVFKQIPILVEGQSDNSFDSGDRIIFYANSPDKVERDVAGNFSHQVHPYSNENYVFLTIGSESGERLSPVNNNLAAPSSTINTFTDFIWKEEELYRAEERHKSGRDWLGQRFPASSNGVWNTILRDTLPGITPSQVVKIEGELVSRSSNSSSFDVRMNNSSTSSSIYFTRIDYNESTGESAESLRFNTSSSVLNGNQIELEARYRHSDPNSTGFVNWLRITLNRRLQAKNNRLFFFTSYNGSDNEIARYQLTGFSEEPTVMDVTDVTSPKLLSVSASGNSYNLNYYTGPNLQIMAQSGYSTPAMGESIESQNIQAIAGYPEYLIITSESFRDYAEDLAGYREQQDGLSSLIVTQEQILNEFSNGVSDPTAIRNYVKFLYDRALQNGQEPPRYLLLFGDTTFDYKNIIEDSYTNYLLTYQTEESLHRTQSFGTDDYLGFLDDNEGDIDGSTTPSSHLIDIGIGRISAQTETEARIAIDKIKRYENPENNGDWQNIFTFAADDDLPEPDVNRDEHTYNADVTSRRLQIVEPGIRINKIYEFNYPEEITGSGRQIPGATDAFINSFNNGTLVLNYSGHGNEQTLSDENLFHINDIPRLNNRDKLAVLVTATCQFGRYDDIDVQSGAEQLFFAENGGAIAAFTTTRVVYTSVRESSNNNFALNIAMSQRITERNPDGSPQRMGDIIKNTKNSIISGNRIISSDNNKKFILIGDPAGKFKLPENRIRLSQINDQNSDTGMVTIQALDQVNLSGEITSPSGQLLSDYNGEATITVFDAPREVNLPTDRDWVREDRCVLDECSYQVENDIIFKGKAGVENGRFSSTFVVPKDISFSEETGRIVFYAEGTENTAGGSFTNVQFNGINEDAENDGQGPEMDVFLNDERFVNGNLVNSSPTLIIELEDQSGINTTGTGVGHEIIATIDTKPQQSFVLNDFYEGSLNDFTRGRIEYPLDQLPEGSYTLTARAWDVHNNPSEKEIFFEVKSNEELSVRNVFNFPNPMNDATRFTFEHNQPGTPLDVSIRIYTLSGKPVQQIQESLITTSSYASISWDGRDRDYDRLGNGTYIYVLRVAANTPKGRQSTEQIEKLVIIR